MTEISVTFGKSSYQYTVDFDGISRGGNTGMTQTGAWKPSVVFYGLYDIEWTDDIEVSLEAGQAIAIGSELHCFTKETPLYFARGATDLCFKVTVPHLSSRLSWKMKPCHPPQDMEVDYGRFRLEYGIFGPGTVINMGGPPSQDEHFDAYMQTWRIEPYKLCL